jgi:hypothetical protein
VPRDFPGVFVAQLGAKAAPPRQVIGQDLTAVAVAFFHRVGGWGVYAMKRTGMRDAVLRLHKANPEWTSGQIASAVGCTAPYVVDTMRRAGCKLPGSAIIRQLGIAAMAEGLTLHDIRNFKNIRALARQRSAA